MADDTTDLYGLPHDEFTKARDAMTARLRKAGERDAAAAVKALKRPTVPAWATNQLARRHPDEVEALLDAAARLGRLQQDALRGKASDDMRDATRARREAVSKLVKHAEAILADGGHAVAASTLDKVSRTLYAASADTSAGERLRAGTLERELEPSGFGDLGTLTVVPSAPDEQDDDAAAREAERESARKAEERARLEKRVADLRATAEKAEAKAAELRERADEAERVAIDARRAAEDAAKELDD